MVGKTVLGPLHDKMSKTIQLEPEQRFPVEAGDVIGMFFPFKLICTKIKEALLYYPWIVVGFGVDIGFKFDIHFNK